MASAQEKIEASLRDLQKEVDTFVKDLVPEKIVLLQKKLSFQALTLIVKKTPVDTGRARGNWQVTIDFAPINSIDNTSIAEVFSKANTELSKLKPFQNVYITNNVEYVIYLEEGSSSQAPYGMVAISIQELAEQFK